ncbi:MAG: TMEM175 family protein [Nocardioides sp.]
MTDDSSRQPAPAGGGSAEGSTRLLPKGRLEAFSDGVFAIVVTLLVLELKVPEDGATLGHNLAAEWPAYLGYFISFAFIGGSWIAHSNMTRFIKNVDAVLMRLNLLLLLAVSFLPFTTSIAATHLNDPGERLAVVLFGLNLTMAAGLVDVLLAYAARAPQLAADDVAEEELQGFEKERRVALALQGAATLVAVFLPVVAILVFLAVSLLLLLEPLWRAQRRRHAKEQPGPTAR